MERLTTGVGALAFLGATTVVAYIAVVRTGDPAVTALGALIALVSAGAGYFLRGRVQAPASNDGAPPPPHPAVAVERAQAVNVAAQPEPPPAPSISPSSPRHSVPAGRDEP